jgi:N6-adenosine-specific RNA methylase IME4
MRLQAHPYAEIFALIEGAAFTEFVEDIRVHGLRDKIVLLDGMVLDGRNRGNALAFLTESGEVLGEGWGHRAGEPLDADMLVPSSDNLLFRTYDPGKDGPDPFDWVWSKNFNRRHQTVSQRAYALAERERFRHGGRRQGLEENAEPDQDANLRLETRAELAERGQVSERSINSAAVVRDHGIDDLKTAVRQGRVTVSAAEEIAAQLPERQAQILRSLPRDADGRLTADVKKALAPVIKEIRADKQVEKKQRRDDREAELGRRLLAMPDKKYGVAIEDFEWDHEPWSRETGMDRHPSNHYPTAADAHTPEEIVARTAERFKCLADDSVLYMWATIPHAAIAYRVLELRGFRYVTQRVWGKLRSGNGRGPGYWVTGEHEILLIAVRGNVVPPSTAHFRSFFAAPVGEHSEKPDEQYEHAEFHFPNLPKIELNARRRRQGWEAWGFDAPAVTEIPREEASGTAREAPSTGCGTSDANQNVGLQAAPPHHFSPIEGACCANFAEARDALDLPPFLRRISAA